MPGAIVRPPRFGPALARARPPSPRLKPGPAVSCAKGVSGTHVLDLFKQPPAFAARQRWRHAMTHLAMLRITVKDGQRGLLTRNGRLDSVLAPGRHRLFDPLHQLEVELFDVVRAEFPADRYAALKAARPDIAADLFEAVETRGGEVAIVSLDGRPAHVMGPWRVRVYWKVATRVEAERIDVANDPLVSPRHLAMVERTRVAAAGADGRQALVAAVTARAAQAYVS